MFYKCDKFHRAVVIFSCLPGFERWSLCYQSSFHICDELKIQYAVNITVQSQHFNGVSLTQHPQRFFREPSRNTHPQDIFQKIQLFQFSMMLQYQTIIISCRETSYHAVCTRNSIPMVDSFQIKVNPKAMKFLLSQKILFCLH